METELPRGHKRGSLSSPLLLERNPTRPAAAQKNPGDCPIHIVIRESRRNSRKTTRFPPSSRDEALSFCSISSEIPRSLLKFKTGLDTLDAPKKSPDIPASLERNTESPAPLNLSPFSLPDLDMSVDSPALSGKVSRPAPRTSGGGQSHKEIQEVTPWVMPHSERHQFTRPLLIRTRCPDTSLNVTLWMRSQHQGALTPQLHHLEKPTGSKYNSTSGLSPHQQLERQAEFHCSTQDEA